MCQNVHARDASTCLGLLDLCHTHDDFFHIDPDGLNEFDVYCELNPDSEDGSVSAGWTVLQRRVDETEDFRLTTTHIITLWIQYKRNFFKRRKNNQIFQSLCASTLQIKIKSGIFQGERLDYPFTQICKCVT